MKFAELLGSDQFDRAVTCGAVYGFVSALLAFNFCYCGERIVARCNAEGDK